MVGRLFEKFIRNYVSKSYFVEEYCWWRKKGDKVGVRIETREKCTTSLYSYLNASTGSSFDALLAGYIPKKIPTPTAKKNASSIELKVITD